jgi:hypothetical protein
MSIYVMAEIFPAQIPDQEYTVKRNSRGRARGRTKMQVVKVKSHVMKAVLLSLANHAHDDWTNTHPSIKTIREETSLQSNTTICAALGALENLKAIIHTGTKSGGTKVFTITQDVIVKFSPQLHPMEPAITATVIPELHTVEPGITEAVNEPSLNRPSTVIEPEEPPALSPARDDTEKESAWESSMNVSTARADKPVRQVAPTTWAKKGRADPSQEPDRKRYATGEFSAFIAQE